MIEKKVPKRYGRDKTSKRLEVGEGVILGGGSVDRLSAFGVGGMKHDNQPKSEDDSRVRNFSISKSENVSGPVTLDGLQSGISTGTEGKYEK